MTKNVLAIILGKVNLIKEKVISNNYTFFFRMDRNFNKISKRPAL